MANTFETIVKKVANGIEWPFVHSGELAADIAEGLKEYPAAKTAILGLVSEIESVVSASAVAVAASGTSATKDVAAVTAAEALFSYVNTTFLPAIEAVYKEVKSEVTANAASTTAS